MATQRLKEVVEDWLFNSQFEDGDATMYDVVKDAPQLAWAAILQLLEVELTDAQIALLAAGPLEDLLALHGRQFIERVEHEAVRNARFNNLLGGVWESSIPLDIWARVERARKSVW